ncbi:MAG: hypothetical protein K2O03_02960, partial [Lachnospiraceae bacterium]|nr:hypothetical protein [Lachnospiraceae bacterium]
MKKHMSRKEKIIIILLLIFAGLILCLVEIFAKQPYERALDAIGANKIRRQKTYSWDGVNTHGFFGDGSSYFLFRLSGKKQMEEVLEGEGWHSLPVDERIIDETENVLKNLENDISET